MSTAPRYAIYFAPAPETAWWRFGCEWLGRDAVSGEARIQPAVPGMPADRLARLTAAPRAYGFHATLKAPFRLAAGARADDVHEIAAALARRNEPFGLGEITAAPIGGFIALQAKQAPAQLRRLADDCVRGFDALRAPADQAELTRRREGGLTHRQEALLSAWGYPHVIDEWRFHMSLTGDVEGAECRLLTDWLASRVQSLNVEALVADAICVFEQATPAVPFRLTHRFGFDGVPTRHRAGRGRLFYVVGASGAGKDSLIDYAKRELSGRPIAFAHRYITRDAASGGENHVALSADEFAARERAGAFAMHWTSNGHCYGIGIEIDRWVEMGLDVVVNGSRANLDKARARYPQLRLVWIEAAPAVLRARLAARGREDTDAIEARLVRAAAFRPPADAVVIENNGPLEAAGERLVRELAAAANDAAA